MYLNLYVYFFEEALLLHLTLRNLKRRLCAKRNGYFFRTTFNKLARLLCSVGKLLKHHFFHCAYLLCCKATWLAITFKCTHHHLTCYFSYLWPILLGRWHMECATGNIYFSNRLSSIFTWEDHHFFLLQWRRFITQKMVLCSRQD